ncbi:hypothetical protein MIF8_3 [Erwinia phage MIF8]
MSIVLNEGQKAAIESIKEFMCSPDEQFMSLEGPPGTGKTTVIKYVVQALAEQYKTRKLLGIIERQRNIVFCATTNKACEALEQALQGTQRAFPVKTIHSHLNLIMQQDANFKDVLYDSNPEGQRVNELIFIDEGSFIDNEEMHYIKKKMHKSSRVIFMGDPAQLKKANATNMPAFDSGFRKAELTEIMRQVGDDNPIKKLSAQLREAVLEGKGRLPPAIIDGKHIRWLPREDFNKTMLADMSAPDWTYKTSKFIAYRNKVVQSYNKTLYNSIQKSAVLIPGDYAINNNFVKGTKQTGSIGTDRLVLIDQVTPAVELNTKGHWVSLDGQLARKFFLPDDHATIDRKINSRVRKLATLDPMTPEHADVAREIQSIKNLWVDLRPVYACTVYKSQGSTYRRVYVDLKDLGSCGNRDQMLRMLLVAISRASHQVFLTGDLS